MFWGAWQVREFHSCLSHLWALKKCELCVCVYIDVVFVCTTYTHLHVHVHVITTLSTTHYLAFSVPISLSPLSFLLSPSLPPSLSLSLRPHSHYRAVVRVHTRWTRSPPMPVGQRSTTPQRVCGMTPQQDCTTTSPVSLNLSQYMYKHVYL